MKTPEAERQAWVRVPKNGQADRRLPANGAPLSARVRNISFGGINLLVGQQIESGTLVQVEVPNRFDDQPLRLWVRVLYAAQESEQQWNIGCVFAQEMEAENLQSFRADRSRMSKLEQRVAVRHACDVPTVCRLLDEDLQRWPGRIKDISILGLGVLIGHPFRAGTVLNVELPGADGKPYLVQATVVHSRVQGELNWTMGCSLIRPLSDVELQAVLAIKSS